MLAGDTRPLIFVDIDGVLIPFWPRATGTDCRSSGGEEFAPDRSGNPLLDRLDPDHGRQLLALPGELVWASTWMAEANEVVAPRLNLPVLPIVDWPDTDEQPQRGMHWKTAPLTRRAAGRPFVWLDDEINDVDRRWVAAHHPESALLHRVDPYLCPRRAGLSLRTLPAGGRATKAERRDQWCGDGAPAPTPRPGLQPHDDHDVERADR